MTLKEIFNNKPSENYLMSYLNDDFRDDFIIKRNISTEVSKDDIPIILELLGDGDKKWFVASYIRTVERFDDDLLKKIIEVGINTFDPSYNSFFIRPCVRIFGCLKVIELLGDLLENNFKKASGILSLLYHIESLICSIGKRTFDGKWEWEDVGFKYEWSSKNQRYGFYSKDNDRRMTLEEFENYRPIHHEFLKRKKNLILKIKEKTDNPLLIKSANRMLSL